MYSFIINTQPKSYNSRKLKSYQTKIVSAFGESYPEHAPLATELYGLIYHFFRRDIGIDADNLSKPVWDCLSGILFNDDKQVKMRIAGSFDLTANNFTIIDFTGLPGKNIGLLLEALETQEHVLYVECGSFTMDMIRLNLEKNGN